MIMIELSEVYDFALSDVDVRSSVSEYHRPIMMGNNILRSQHVFDTRIQETVEDFLVFSLCLSGKDPSGKPHDVKVTIRKQDRQITAHCTCIAGIQGKCKHTTAVLLQLERMSPEDIARATCTDLPQAWGKKGNTRTFLFNPVPVEQFCHLPKRKRRSEWPILELPPAAVETVRRIMLEGSPDCAFKKMLDGRGTTNKIHEVENPDVQVFTMPEFLYEELVNVDALSIPNDQGLLYFQSSEAQNFYFRYVFVSTYDVKRIFGDTITQNNLRWKGERQVRVTGYTAHKYKTKSKKSDWNKKCTGLIFSTFTGNANTRYGHDHERPALQCFAKGHPHKTMLLDLGLCVHVSVPHFGYSPDGIMDDMLLQVKCPTAGQSFKGRELCERLKFLININDVFSLKTTHEYYTQCQFGLAILNLKMAKFIVYYNVNGNDEGVLAFDVPRNDAFIEGLLETLNFNYFKCILPFLIANEQKLIISQL